LFLQTDQETLGQQKVVYVVYKYKNKKRQRWRRETENNDTSIILLSCPIIALFLSLYIQLSTDFICIFNHWTTQL